MSIPKPPLVAIGAVPACDMIDGRCSAADARLKLARPAIESAAWLVSAFSVVGASVAEVAESMCAMWMRRAFALDALKVLNRPTYSARTLGAVDSLVGLVAQQREVVDPVVGLIAIDVVDMHTARDRSICSFPDGLMFKGTPSASNIHAYIAGLVGAFTTSPMPVVSASRMAEALAAIGAEARANTVPSRSSVGLGWCAAVLARLRRPGLGCHGHMVGHFV